MNFENQNNQNIRYIETILNGGQRHQPLQLIGAALDRSRDIHHPKPLRLR